MSANGTLFVAHCPLEAVAICHWKSDPLPTDPEAREKLRLHVHQHHHSELVAFVAEHVGTEIESYTKVQDH